MSEEVAVRKANVVDAIGRIFIGYRQDGDDVVMQFEHPDTGRVCEVTVRAYRNPNAPFADFVAVMD